MLDTIFKFFFSTEVINFLSRISVRFSTAESGSSPISRLQSTASKTSTFQRNKMARQMIKSILQDLHGVSFQFAEDNIKNAALRVEYIKRVQLGADEILEEARNATKKKGANTATIWEEASKKASEYRNFMLDQTRERIPKVFKEFSKMVKEEGLTFPTLVQKYATKFYSKNYANLSVNEQERVLEAITEASGRTNSGVNKIAEMLGTCGRIVVWITRAFAIYNICESENKTLTAVSLVISALAGKKVAKLGSEVGAAIAKCGGHAGVILGAILGQTTLGYFAEFTVDRLIKFMWSAIFPSEFNVVDDLLFEDLSKLYL